MPRVHMWYVLQLQVELPDRKSDATCLYTAGKRRLRVELLLPEDGSSPFEGDGWPGGVKQQFAAVRPMVEATLMQLKQLPEFAVGITLLLL